MSQPTRNSRPQNLNLTNFNRPLDHISLPQSPRDRSLSPPRSTNGRNGRSPSPRLPRSAPRTPGETDKLIGDTQSANPPMAGSEVDAFDVDNRETVNKPYPGVDDGFFSAEGSNNPDVEDVPTIGSRAGEGTDTTFDVPTSPDAGAMPRRPFPDVANNIPEKGFPRFPDFELGNTNTDLESIPDINIYQHKKTLAQGMMDLALFSANANQLRYVLESSGHPYYYPGLVLITISLFLQVGVGVGLIWNSRYNVKDDREICIANKINNFTIIGIFLTTVINVFISAFGTTSVITSTSQVAFPISVRTGDFDTATDRI